MSGSRTISLADVRQSQRRPFAYATSARIDEVPVVDERGQMGMLLLKCVAPQVPKPSVRPAFTIDCLREPAVYEHLGGLVSGVMPRCRGVLQDDEGLWLVLERLEGRPLWQCGEDDTWIAAAAWLAEMHGRFSALLPSQRVASRLIVVDWSWCGRWLDRLRGRLSAQSGALWNRWSSIETAYHVACARLLAEPPTLVHGECYPSNLMVLDAQEGPPALRAVDWETARWGPAWLDLAALTAGTLEPSLCDRMVGAYLRKARALGFWRGSAKDASRLLWAARVHVAVQWLAWSEAWSPPLDHRRDWGSELVGLLEEVAA